METPVVALIAVATPLGTARQQCGGSGTVGPMTTAQREPGMDRAYEGYLDALGAVDYGRALTELKSALARGVPWDRLVSDVIGPAQRRVGELWVDGSIGVADEHAATAVAEDVLAVLSPPSSTPTATSRVVMVCSEGEWHTFPLKLASTVATRSPGLQVTVLGGSISGDHLRRFLRGTQVDAVALSTTLEAHLIGAAASIRAAVEEGVPVVVGGSAWGAGQRRARLLGANVRVTDPGALGDAVRALGGPRQVSELPQIPDEALLLNDPPEQLLGLAFRHQAQRSAWMRSMNYAQERHTMTDLGWMARYAANAVACEDAAIMGDMLRWLLQLLSPRQVPATTVLDSARFLADAVEPVAPRGAHVLRTQADVVQEHAGAPAESVS